MSLAWDGYVTGLLSVRHVDTRNADKDFAKCNMHEEETRLAEQRERRRGRLKLSERSGSG